MSRVHGVSRVSFVRGEEGEGESGAQCKHIRTETIRREQHSKDNSYRLDESGYLCYLSRAKQFPSSQEPVQSIIKLNEDLRAECCIVIPTFATCS